VLRPFVVTELEMVSEMAAPLIGITTDRYLGGLGLTQQGITQAYIESVYQAGGCPVLVPLGGPSDAYVELVKRLDGILFTGGGDVQPAAYASQPHPRVAYVDEDRDRVEIALLPLTIERRLPFLGVCRGLQVINVALGGTLFEDIADQRPDSLKHDYSPGYPRNFLAHPVDIKAESLLAQVLGVHQAQVNSLHHQAARRLAAGLVPNAFSPDGVVEGLELPDYPFGLAVQWHPEWLQEQLCMRALFRAFIQAAEARHAS
jgi:putative glutamine amidotransferase